VVILTKELREWDARGTRIYLASRKSCDIRHMTLPQYSTSYIYFIYYILGTSEAHILPYFEHVTKYIK
jgi:hypothetical protein